VGFAPTLLEIRGNIMRTITRRKALLLGLTSTAAATIGAVPRAQAVPGYAVDATLQEFYGRVRGGHALVRRAAGVLVFPRIYKAGIGIGGEYGEGVLLVRGRRVAEYNSVSASIGFQLGAQARSVIILFMTDEALDRFSRTDGWKIGVDGSVALITVGAGGSIDSDRIANPVVGFIFDNKGLMYNLTLEGTKITRISRY
jgi:lipid-binding SYLF domain-containing protein